MNSELNKKGRRVSLFMYILAILFVIAGIFALAFSQTSLLKSGPNLTKEQYQKPKTYYNIEIDKISNKLGTADNGKFHYYMVMDKNKNINLYEVGSKEAGKLSATDMGSYKATKAIETVRMPIHIREQLKKSLDPRDYEDINKETILSHYEMENTKTGFTIFGIIAMAIAAFMIIFTMKKGSKNSEMLFNFQQQYPQITDMDSLKRECDFGVPEIGVYIKGDYIISDHGGFNIEDLKNVVWMYQHIQRYYFIVTNRNINLFGYTGNAVLPIKGRKNTVEEGLAQLFGYISQNFPHILIGFDAQNGKLCKERIKEYKNSGKMEGY